MMKLKGLICTVSILMCGMVCNAQDFYADSLASEAAREAETPVDTVQSCFDVDSLLGCWYEALTKGDIGQINDSTSARYTTDVPDSILVKRLEEMNAYITVPFNTTVKNYMVLYSEKSRAKMGNLLALCKYYMPIFEEAFDRYDLPLELKYMAIIESSLNPTARSRAGARGMWQFMYNTARLYGLKITSFVDERLDVEKSADAAARYLRDAYNVFGDWNLAISSYNCGSGNVNKAIHRAGGRRDFWSIYPFLPRETRGYVPAFVGAMYAITYADEYGLKPDDLDIPPFTDSLEIKKNLHFKQVSEMLDIPLETLRILNPQYTHDIIPGNEGTYILKLPFNYTTAFIDRADTIYTHKADSLMSPSVLKSIKEGGDGETIRYKVKEGDYLGRIASRYGCSVEQIRKWNGLKSNTIRIGQTLYIYRGGAAPAASSASFHPKSSQPSSQKPATPSPAAAAPPAGTDGYVTYTVKSGDSLYSIAKNYPGVSAADIMRLNGISSAIKPGQKIKIPKP